MPKFAKAINSKNAKAKTKKKEPFFQTFTRLSMSLPFISCPTLELPAVMVFESSKVGQLIEGNQHSASGES